MSASLATPVESNRQKTGAAQAVLLFDGQCAFCRKSVAILKKLDWLKAVRYQNGRDVELLPMTHPPLEPNRLTEEMHLVTADRRRVYHGFGAFRWLAWRLPVLWLVAPFLYLPGVPWLGQKAYLWIAKNRFKLVPCKDGVCDLPRRQDRHS